MGTGTEGSDLATALGSKAFGEIDILCEFDALILRVRVLTGLGLGTRHLA